MSAPIIALECTTPRSFQHDPYGPTGKRYNGEAVSPSGGSTYGDCATSVSSLGTFPDVTPVFGPEVCHPALRQHVSFYAYPEDDAQGTMEYIPKEALCRLFVGQLPYHISDAEINFAIRNATDGAVSSLHYIERIIHWKKGRQPTGCIHAYCHPCEYEMLQNMVHQRVLFDDAGFWFATDAVQQDELLGYCQFLSENKDQRPAQRPYQLMTVDLAKSTYQPSEGFNPRLAQHGRHACPPPHAAQESFFPAQFSGVTQRIRNLPQWK